MIYLDNAATGGFKPNAVTSAVSTVSRYLCANPGRSGHRLSITGAEIVSSARQVLTQFLGGNPERVAFTKNCTEALNLAIFGSLKKGGHVITTVFEHNSVLRPLTALEKAGKITLDIVKADSQDLLSQIKKKINDKTYMVVTTALSNVTGEELPVSDIGELCKNNNLLYLVDGAQGAGHISLNIGRQNVSMLAVAGHKGLYGIMGSGALILNDSVELTPLIYGGTGTDSLSLSAPTSYPERLEAGTLSLPAIASLCEGVKYIKSNLGTFSEYLLSSTAKLISALNRIEGVKCYSMPNRAGIVAFRLLELSSEQVADILSCDYDIAVRGGLHCAPLMHKFLGTDSCGLVRVSLAVQNSNFEINALVKAIKKIVKG